MVIGHFIGRVINLGAAKVTPKGSRIQVDKAVKTAQGIINSPKSTMSEVEVKVTQLRKEQSEKSQYERMKKVHPHDHANINRIYNESPKEKDVIKDSFGRTIGNRTATNVVKTVQGITGHGPDVRVKVDGKVYVHELHLSEIEKSNIRYAAKPTAANPAGGVHGFIGDDGSGYWQVAKQQPSIAVQTTQARKEWKNILKDPGSISKERAGSVRFQYFWSTFKPRTKFNQGIKKRVMDRTMTERQAIMTIKKHRKKVGKQYLKDGKISAKNKQIENELELHDANMYREGNRADKGKVSDISDFQNTMQGLKAFSHDSSTFLKFAEDGKIRSPLKIIKKKWGADGQHGAMFHEYLEGTRKAERPDFISRILHDQKVKKVNELDQDAVTLGYGLGGKKVPGWESSLPASRVADKILTRKNIPPEYFGAYDGLVRYSDFESFQFGTEIGAFASGFPRNIPQVNKGLSTYPSDAIIKFTLHPVSDMSKRKKGWTKLDDYRVGHGYLSDGGTGKVYEGATNKSASHIHLDDINPMAFGFPVDKKNKKKTPLSGQKFNEMLVRAHDEFSPSPEFPTIRDTDGNAGLPAGRFYTAGQQSYSRDNAKLWRAIGLGLGGPATFGAATLGSKKDRKNDGWGYW